MAFFQCATDSRCLSDPSKVANPTGCLDGHVRLYLLSLSLSLPVPSRWMRVCVELYERTQTLGAKPTARPLTNRWIYTFFFSSFRYRFLDSTPDIMQVNKRRDRTNRSFFINGHRIPYKAYWNISSAFFSKSSRRRRDAGWMVDELQREWIKERQEK